MHAPLRAVSQQVLEPWGIRGCGDDQDLSNPTEHQGAQRIVDHGLVIHRQQLLGDRLGDRVQACARSPSENEAFSGFLSHGWRGFKREKALILVPKTKPPIFGEGAVQIS